MCCLETSAGQKPMISVALGRPPAKPVTPGGPLVTRLLSKYDRGLGVRFSGSDLSDSSVVWKERKEKLRPEWFKPILIIVRLAATKSDRRLRRKARAITKEAENDAL